MLFNFLKWLSKVLLMGVIWVFVLSIRFNEKTLFSTFHGYLVKNSLITNLTEELSYLWEHTSASSKTTLSRVLESQDLEPTTTAVDEDEVDKG